MKKKEIIKKSNDYTKVINKNNKLKNKYYSLFYIKSDNTLFGISIPKKIGNAVIRNKNKRQIKNIIDNNKNNIQNGYNYVIIIRKEILSLSYQEKEQELINLFKKIGEKNEKQKN
ncbi:MAG: ribonuclease P protein component [Bacilli bacterium]|nr:ribonuclease P protein component [Bacilli bacterium]